MKVMQLEDYAEARAAPREQSEWRALVASGKELAKADRGDTRFALGDLALRVEPPGPRGVKTGSLERLGAYAEAIGIEFDALRKYRMVALAWPDGTRVPSGLWTLHRALMAYPDRADLIGSRDWTPAALAELKEERHPKVLPPRDERWWLAQQEALKHLRSWTLERIARVPHAERRRRAEFIREEAELAQKVAEQLEQAGKKERL